MTVCPYCERPLHLWGGETCDVCDRDSNGINDRDEPIGLSTTDIRLLLPPEEKGFALLATTQPALIRRKVIRSPRFMEGGFELVGSVRREKLVPRYLLNDPALAELKLKVLQILHRRLVQEESVG